MPANAATDVGKCECLLPLLGALTAAVAMESAVQKQIFYMVQWCHSWVATQKTLYPIRNTTFPGALLTMSTEWKQPRYPITGELIMKIQLLRKMKSPGKWVELEIIVLSEETSTEHSILNHVKTEI